MIRDLQAKEDVPGRLPLLVPVPNRGQTDAVGRNLWHPNPAFGELGLFVWLGKLVGICLRSDLKVDLCLSALVWKGLVGEVVVLRDMAQFDKALHSRLDSMLDEGTLRAQGITQENFEDVYCQTFEFAANSGEEGSGGGAGGAGAGNSEGSLVELKDGGSDIDLTWYNRHEWCDLVARLRLHEADRQVAAIRAGLVQVVPADALCLFTHLELEALVCGTPEIDVKLLKRTCRYSGVSQSDSCVKHFWTALESFDQKQRADFLQFVWGHSRLPSRLVGDDSLYITPLHHATPDMALPVTHTCFFQLELPNYTSAEICSDRLLYAAQNCTFFANG
jgi:hypothetical protein